MIEGLGVAFGQTSLLHEGWVNLISCLWGNGCYETVNMLLNRILEASKGVSRLNFSTHPTYSFSEPHRPNVECTPPLSLLL